MCSYRSCNFLCNNFKYLFTNYLDVSIEYEYNNVNTKDDFLLKIFHIIKIFQKKKNFIKSFSYSKKNFMVRGEAKFIYEINLE